MKIGIDARFYGITGIGRYAKNLIKELEKLGGKNEYIIFLWKKTFDAYRPQNPNFKKVLADYPLYSFLEQAMLPIAIWREKIDLMHFTNFNVPILYFGKYVMTIHDLIHMEHSTFGSTTRFLPYYFFKKIIYTLSIRLSALRAKKILVPSEDAKSDVVQKLGVKPEKVMVTYEGIDTSLNAKCKIPNIKCEEVLSKYKIKKPYLLYVGTMYPHKNHERLLLAFKKLIKAVKLSSCQSVKLILVAKVDFFSRQLKEKIEEMGLSERVVLPGFVAPDGYVPDEDLKIIYQNADVYVFPSLKEGFGLPILESFAAGVPVVCANISSLPEVAGNAASFFDPYDINDMAKKIKKVLEDENLRKSLAQKGKNQLKKFSWEKMAKKTQAIYFAIS